MADVVVQAMLQIEIDHDVQDDGITIPDFQVWWSASMLSKIARDPL